MPYGLGPGLINVEPGTIALFDSLATHQVGYPSFAPDAEHLWISLLPEVFAARILCVRRGKTRVQASAALFCDAENLGMAPTLRALGLAPSPGAPCEVRDMRLATVVAAMVASLVEHGYAPKTEHWRAEQEARMITSIQNHLRETAGAGAGVASPAKIAGCSPFHFMRLFRRRTGNTVLGHINLCRAKKAAALRAQGRNMKEIGCALGFSCPQTFSRWFRKHGIA